MKKLIFPVILPIMFLFCTKSVYKPGYELPSMIVVAALGIVFGILVNLMIFQAAQNDKPAEK